MLEMSREELLIAQKLVQEDYYYFVRLMFKARHGFKWHRAKHHQIICDALMRVFRGETKRLIINLPPRYSKTELAVVNFVPWCLGMVPDAEFIHTSYAARLAASNSWQARELVMHEDYNKVFPGVQVRDDTQAKDEWRTTAGGCVYAAGAQGTITGFGAGKVRPGFGGAIIIDDPHKPGEADSDVVRPQTIKWFQDTLESRKNSKDTPIILIMQRLHEEDLAGWLLNGGNGETWEHINLPALQEDGTALWEEKHSVADLLLMQESKPWSFSSQYQQKPVPPEGGIFKPDKLQVVDSTPGTVVQWVRSWDLAATKDDGDWTVGSLLGKTSDNRFYLRDVVRFQGSPDQVEQRMLSVAKLDGPRVKIKLPQDPGQAGKAQITYLTRALGGFSVESAPVTGDKITRAEPFASQVNVGSVSIQRAEWNYSFTNELRNFPYGKNDDQVDSVSDGFNTLFQKSRSGGIVGSLM